MTAICLPSFAIITDGKTSDIKVARQFHFEPYTLVVNDRGFKDEIIELTGKESS